MKKKLIAIAIGVFAMPAFTYAATDGTIGTTSTGTANITITIPKLIRIRSMADCNNIYNGESTGTITCNDTMNVSQNYSGTYKVRGTGSGASSAFTITDGSQTIAYTVHYNDAANNTGEVAMTAGTDVTAQSGAATTLAGSTLNSNLKITVPEANMQAVNSGTYTGTLTLLYSPE